MDTKTRTRTDNQGKPNPSGEVQVRELGDVLRSVEEPENEELRELLKDALQQKRENSGNLKKQFKTDLTIYGYEEIYESEELDGKLDKILVKTDYVTTKVNEKTNMFVKTNKDKSLEVFLKHDIIKTEVGNKVKGYSYIRMENQQEYETFFDKYKKLISNNSPIVSYTLISSFGGGIIGLTSGINYLVNASSEVGSANPAIYFGLLLGGCFTGTSVGLIASSVAIKRRKRKLKKFKETYSEKVIVGKEAIKKAIYTNNKLHL